ncbi:MAG: DUF5683 domain-containing protein [Paludibacter sp.]|nr:DUF5683 domain-containing protein [Paludibacter sp.]
MSTGVQAQVVSIKNRAPKDTLVTLSGSKIISNKVSDIQDSTFKKAFKPDPFKVVWMAAIIPGYGQIMNRKYWKLPIVYGGFLGCAYAITWNSGMYNSYKNAYLDIYAYNQGDINYKRKIDQNPSAVSFYQIIPKGYNINSPGINGYANWETILSGRMSIYRRYRDLSILVTIGYYALTLVDAYVDAQLYDFDISPNLSMRVQPTLLKNGNGVPNTFAMQCNFNLK